MGTENEGNKTKWMSRTRIKIPWKEINSEQTEAEPKK